MPRPRHQPLRHRFGVFDVRNVRVTSWSVPANKSDGTPWKDVTGDEWGSDASAEPKRPWPQAKGKRRR